MDINSINQPRLFWLRREDGSTIPGMGKAYGDGTFWAVVDAADMPPDLKQGADEAPYYELVVPMKDVLFSKPE